MEDARLRRHVRDVTAARVTPQLRAWRHSCATSHTAQHARHAALQRSAAGFTHNPRCWCCSPHRLFASLPALPGRHPSCPPVPPARPPARPPACAPRSEQRIKELTAINQSLSNLGNVVSALLQSKRKHVPYRNSRLTRLLQDSLGGNTRTTFIVTLSPSADATDETVSTLQFADRAKQVVVHTSVNEELANKDVLKKHQHEIARLKVRWWAMAVGSTAACGAPSPLALPVQCAA